MKRSLHASHYIVPFILDACLRCQGENKQDDCVGMCIHDVIMSAFYFIILFHFFTFFNI